MAHDTDGSYWEVRDEDAIRSEVSLSTQLLDAVRQEIVRARDQCLSECRGTLEDCHACIHQRVMDRAAQEQATLNRLRDNVSLGLLKEVAMLGAFGADVGIPLTQEAMMTTPGSPTFLGLGSPAVQTSHGAQLGCPPICTTAPEISQTVPPVTPPAIPPATADGTPARVQPPCPPGYMQVASPSDPGGFV
jgi:hypothetical protein